MEMKWAKNGLKKVWKISTLPIFFFEGVHKLKQDSKEIFRKYNKFFYSDPTTMKSELLILRFNDSANETGLQSAQKAEIDYR